MDITPRKGTPPLSSPKSSAIPDRSLSGSRETNENEQPLDQKPVTKNFMSPTISAGSKASDPIRKKILAERNELPSSCEGLPHKASNLGSKTNSLNSTSHRSGKLPISSYSYASEYDNDQDNNSVVDSSYKPYDPRTNDLVPRPKYLRYQPNRRRGNFLPQEGCSLLAPQKSNDNEEPSNPPEKYNLELENEDVGDGVEEDEEEMEEVVDREWSLKGVFKLLLLLVVFFLSSTNLSSRNRNPMVTSDTVNVIRKNIFEAVVDEIYGSGSVYVDQPEDSQSGFLELSQREINYEPIVELLEVESAEMEKTTEPQEERSADMDIDQEDSTEVEVIQTAHSDEEEESISTAAGEVTSSNGVNEEEFEGFVEQLQRDPEQENLEVLLDDISSTSANEQNAAHSSSKFELAAAENKVEQVENISQEQAGEVEVLETVSEGAEEIETEFEISNLDTEIESENAEVKEIGPSNPVLIIGVSAASVLLVASFVIVYVSRKPKASIETPQAGIPNNPVIASVEGELLERKTETSVKVSSLQEPLNDPSENRRNSHLERTPAIGSITQFSSLCGPTKEASKEISHISAPKIELLGEIMVGEVSSSLRSCVRKNSMTEAEGSNTNLSKGVLPPAQPSVVDSPSYGSFTAEKKILKKKVEKDGEEVKKVVLATPVRRSSRIRDRVGMSP
ncbi:hypothetical protein HAX54_025465 [Datura stramonium]|uniref:Uncharacterized protein n=1 Tax=Datura stramonium TaxID=4076 RepID=A0ABS8V0Q1_DATST|nr:hypothetical protein [Datura stramonium]